MVFESNLFLSYVAVKHGLHHHLDATEQIKTTVDQFGEDMENIWKQDYFTKVATLKGKYPKQIADTVEALLGAVLMDSNDMNQVEKVWNNIFDPYFSIIKQVMEGKHVY